MKTSKFYPGILAAAFAMLMTGCASDDVAQNDDNTQGSDQPSGVVTFTGGTTDDGTAQSKPSAPLTRTSITHTPGNGAIALWSEGDKIWVKDNGGTFRQSAAGTLNTAKTRGVFALASGTYSNGCQVNYVGNGTSGTQVTIAATQTQTTPNDFSHAGASGDCGTASASGDGTAFCFKLDHKASYLCFLPRCMNTDLGPNIRLTKIVVTANVPIAGTYDFADGTLTGKTPASASNSITLTTNNFPLDNTVSNVTKNGAYMVIAPGTYNLTVKYTIKDPTTNVEGDVVKQIDGFTCDEGNICDITAWIDKDLEDVTGTYYTWDAAIGENYWKGHDRDASGNFFPTLVNNGTTANYPSSAIDSRWFNTAYGYAQSNPASRSAADQPNVNLMAHYVEFGDPRWDANRIWCGYGHLYKGGIWLKRRTAPGFPNKSTDYWGIDYRKSANQYINPRADIFYSNSTPPTAAEQSSTYFFLPACGYYLDGKMYDFGFGGHYWTSSASSNDASRAWYIYFSRTQIHVRQYVRRLGSRIAVFY